MHHPLGVVDLPWGWSFRGWAGDAGMGWRRDGTQTRCACSLQTHLARWPF